MSSSGRKNNYSYNNRSRGTSYGKYSNGRPRPRYIARAVSEVWKPGQKFDEVGSFTAVRYQNDDGFVIGTFQNENGDSIVCKGTIPGFMLGAPYKINGKVIEDKNWGTQVNITHVSIVKPTTSDQLVSFLGSGAVTGIGPSTAIKIVNHFGDETLSILENNPERLTEVPGIGSKTIKRIIDSLPEQLKYRDIIGFFSEYGITLRTIKRLIDEYGMTAREKIEENPYILCRVRGFAFTRADQIAMKIGIPRDSPYRIDAGIIATLRWMCDKYGHTLVPKDQLIAETLNKLQIDDRSIIDKSFKRLESDKRMIVDDDGCHLRYLYKAEKNIKKFLRANAGTDVLLPQKRVEKLMSLCAQSNGLSLTDEQARAVYNMFSKKISVLSGSAGTGKTASCRMAVDITKKAGLGVCLVSPTGRAAKHLSEVCDAPGFTMHRALAIVVKEAVDDDFFSDDEQATFTSKTITEAVQIFNKSDIVIADEASMMDTEMAAILFRACRDKHLMLVGDPNQLPSVGPGRVLGDLIDSSYAQLGDSFVTKLTKIFRQAEGSPIIEAANRVQEGKTPTRVNGVTFLPCETNEDVQRNILEHVIPYIRKNNLGYEDYMFLSPIKKTPYAGVDALNAFLRPKLNPHYTQPDDEKKEFLLQRGDQVLMTRNSYDIGVFNGSLGIVDDVNKNGSVDVMFGDIGPDDVIEFEKDETKDLTLAYAMTVHKSQGAQASVVTVVLTDSQFPMLSRNMLYTAITRAEDKLFLVGTPKAFGMAASNRKEDKRLTGLRGI